MNEIWTRGVRLAVMLMLLTGGFTAPAFAADITAGKEYAVLDPAQPVATGDKIEVIEFFYYGCPYCYDALPHILKWKPTLPADVQYRMVPVVGAEHGASLARTYYTLEKMDMLKLHHHVFDSLFMDNLSLSDEKEMFNWAERNHMDRQKFIEIYKSPETEAKVAKAREMTTAYGVVRTPSFVVDGKYLTTSTQAGGLDKLLPAVDQLIVKARNERAAKK
jgi:thiol:disulfide interchange protein DsbA